MIPSRSALSAWATPSINRPNASMPATRLPGKSRIALRLFAIGSMVCSLSGCGGGGDSSSEPGEATFVFRLKGDSRNEEFRIRSSTPAFVGAARDELKKSVADRRLSPWGRVRRGNGGHNSPWGWHLDEATLAQAHTEGCDGRPSEVEADITYWVDRIGSFCPWTAYVAAEER